MIKISGDLGQKLSPDRSDIRSAAIGVFDSGVGGLTLLEKLLQTLPHESFEYYADSGNCPYGSKTKEEILSHTVKIMDYLTQKNCKMIVVACNTVTTNIIDILRSLYQIPIVGMEPGTKPAFSLSRNKRIGILATEGTLNGKLYQKTLENFYDKAFFISEIGYGLVELIENDRMESDTMRERLKKLLMPMIDNQIDTLVLGCTHYNYLIPVLAEIIPYPIEIVDTTHAVSRQVSKLLHENELDSTDTARYVNIVTTGDLTLMNKILKRLDIRESNLSIGKLPV